MNERERLRILKYDVGALKKNIWKHKKNIKIFTEAVKDAKAQIKLLQSYIDMIEQDKKEKPKSVVDLLKRGQGRA